jgi:hypothetical protein
MIDPNKPEAKTQITYPKLLELLGVNSTMAEELKRQ